MHQSAVLIFLGWRRGLQLWYFQIWRRSWWWQGLTFPCEIIIFPCEVMIFPCAVTIFAWYGSDVDGDKAQVHQCKRGLFSVKTGREGLRQHKWWNISFKLHPTTTKHTKPFNLYINTTLHPNHPPKICGIWSISVVFDSNTTDFSKSVVFESNTTDLLESVVSDSNTTDFSETRLSCILSLSCAIVSSSLSFWLSFCLSPHLLFSLQRDVQRSHSL